MAGYILLGRPRGYRGSGGGLASYPVEHTAGTKRDAVRKAITLMGDGTLDALDIWTADQASLTGLGAHVARYERDEYDRCNVCLGLGYKGGYVRGKWKIRDCSSCSGRGLVPGRIRAVEVKT